MLQRVLLGVVLVSLWYLVTPVQAQIELCWTLSPFADELSIIVDQPDPDVGSYQISTMHWDGGGVYALDGAGEADLVLTPGGSIRAILNVKMNNPYQAEGFFDGNPDGSLHASIGLPPPGQPLNGPFSFVFIGTNVPFTHSGILIEHPCGEVVAMDQLAAQGPLRAGQTASEFIPNEGR